MPRASSVKKKYHLHGRDWMASMTVKLYQWAKVNLQRLQSISKYLSSYHIISQLNKIFFIIYIIIGSTDTNGVNASTFKKYQKNWLYFQCGIFVCPKYIFICHKYYGKLFYSSILQRSNYYLWFKSISFEIKLHTIKFFFEILYWQKFREMSFILIQFKLCECHI